MTRTAASWTGAIELARLAARAEEHAGWAGDPDLYDVASALLDLVRLDEDPEVDHELRILAAEGLVDGASDLPVRYELIEGRLPPREALAYAGGYYLAVTCPPAWRGYPEHADAVRGVLFCSRRSGG